MITLGKGKHSVQLDRYDVGDDVLLVLQGGEKPHVGSVVVCQPDKGINLIRLGSHKDYIVLRPLAETACEKYETTVVAVGGIHIDDATKQDIDLVIQNCKEIESCI